ncbi:uncharacterized protein LOC135310045 [Plodia interpunctella]|uniref:uncharacterized protein LOC135310045 n=1 Tax=Plodia interpunctella TaxID=58824 RepID=UPI003100C1E2
MKIGDEYSSYEDLENALDVYKKSVCNEYWIRDARTIVNQRKKYPDTVAKANESLKYYHVRYACIKGGRIFKSRNKKSNRKCKSVKQNCEATIFLRLSPSQKTLKVISLNEEHNHETSESDFKRLAQQRLKLPKNVKQQVKKRLRSGVKKKVVLEQIKQQTGCKMTLKDLDNLSRREKKNIAYNIDLLKNTYKCTNIEVWEDENSCIKGLFFQDERMSKYFEAFPEILYVDRTYCSDMDVATYILMVENANGLSEVVAVCLLVDETDETLDLFIENFKKDNTTSQNVLVVLSDKDMTERRVFGKHFPNAHLIISLYNVLQIFNMEISVEKMKVTTSEVQQAKLFLCKLTNAKSEHEYDTICEEMFDNVPEIIKDYFETHWAPIVDLWAKYSICKNVCLSNTVNNQFQYLDTNCRTINEFIKQLFVNINCFRSVQDRNVAQLLSERSSQPFETGSAKSLYYELLTTFSYRYVEAQLEISELTDINNVGDDAFLTVSTEGLLNITPYDCECVFCKCNHLPCRHIFKCRNILSLPLFDTSLCLNRWTRMYSRHILEMYDSNLDNFGEECTGVTEECVTMRKNLSRQEKYQMFFDRARKMALLCSQVSTPVFYKRLEFIQNNLKLWAKEKNSETDLEFDESDVPTVQTRRNICFHIGQHRIKKERVFEVIDVDNGKRKKRRNSKGSDNSGVVLSSNRTVKDSCDFEYELQSD